MPIQQMLLGSGGGGPEPPGQVTFTTGGNHSWTVPNGVTSISVLCIGAGGSSSTAGGGGGALVWTDNFSCTPGAVLSLHVGDNTATNTGGRDSWFSSTTDLWAGGGNGKTGGTTNGVLRNGLNDGGTAANNNSWRSTKWGAGGAGAAGYSSSSPGANGNYNTDGSDGQNDSAGSGGAASSVGSGSQCYHGGGGGGAGVFGLTVSSSYGQKGLSASSGTSGGDGQGNANQGQTRQGGGTYGGGQGGLSSGTGGTCSASSAGGGVVKIIWPGDTRTWPNNCADV